MIRRSLLSTLTALAVTAATPALAHRGHHTLSVVEIAKDGSLTVTHFLSGHDTEPQLPDLAPDAQPSLDDPDALAALEAHLATAFVVNGTPLKLVSTDFRGDDLKLVYAGKLPSRPKTVKVSYGLYPQAETRPVGMVNIRIGGVTKSLHFHQGDAPKSVTFP